MDKFRLPVPGRALGSVAWKLGLAYRALPKKVTPGIDADGYTTTFEEPVSAELEAAFLRWTEDEWDGGPDGGTAAVHPEDGRFRARLLNVGEWDLNITGAYLFVAGEVLR